MLKFLRKLLSPGGRPDLKQALVPLWNPRTGQLYVPDLSDKPWAVEFDDGPDVLVAAGRFHSERPPTQYYDSAEGRWKPVLEGSVSRKSKARAALPIEAPSRQRPQVVTITPDTEFLVGEDLTFQFLPARPVQFEVRLQSIGAGQSQDLMLDAHAWTVKGGLVEGSYRLRIRWAPIPGPGRVEPWSNWSLPLAFRVHPTSARTSVARLREKQHRLYLMTDRDENGVVMLTDVDAAPPDSAEDGQTRWFRTACYEGATPILNEQADYYQDPLAYYLSCIRQLIRQGSEWLTWHDLLDGKATSVRRGVVLQFDVDAGPRSCRRLFEALNPMGVRATIMAHRCCRGWYTYSLTDEDFRFLREAQQAGWAIGYHNNSLTNIHGMDHVGDYSPTALAEAAERFRQDIGTLREHLEIRTFTHHGGNSLNSRTPVPEGLQLVCVDKPQNPALWGQIRTAFSDGGILCRPCTLWEKVSGLADGIHFFRNHPLKYANFTAPVDVPPLDPSRLPANDPFADAGLDQRIAEEWQKQQRWLDIRRTQRMGLRRGYATIDKPLSRQLGAYAQIRPIVGEFRIRRRETFLRQYPWELGDPRVFWWRLLQRFGPQSGKVLNVGALPPGRKQETTAFLNPDVDVVEMDIDPERQPGIVCDVTEAPSELMGQFDCVLLFGLPYVHSPGKAIEMCRRLVRRGGIGIFGFAADTHPFRGGRYKPTSRPVWRRSLEPLDDPGLRGKLWSFDQEGLPDLLSPWPNREVEFFMHYWFAVCRADA